MQSWEFWVALAAATGIGAILKSFIDHVLQRPANEVNLSDQAVQTAERLLARYQAQLDNADRKLLSAERQISALRRELTNQRSELVQVREQLTRQSAAGRAETQRLRAELHRLGWRESSEGTAS